MRTRRCGFSSIVVAVFTLAAIALIPMNASASPADVNMVENHTFSAGPPDYWVTTEWLAPEGIMTWNQDEGWVHASAPTENHLRWDQTVTVEPHTDYVLSGQIMTSNIGHSDQLVDAGANLSIADELPGTGFFTFSEPLFGNNHWTDRSVRFTTGDHTSITVALGVGMYAGLTTGEAWFRDISLHRAVAGGETDDLLANGTFVYGDPHAWSADSFRAPAASGVEFSWNQDGGWVKINAPMENDARWVQSVPVERDTDYRLSAEIMTVDITHSAQPVDAGANISILERVPGAGFFAFSEPLFGTNDWTRRSLEFNSGDNDFVGIALRVGMYSGETTGTAMFRDVHLAPTSVQPSCTILGTSGDDELTGTDGDDVICGFDGDDTLTGLGGSDILIGGRGNDLLSGNEGADRLFGQAGEDTLFGGPGNDLLAGGGDADVLRGGAGEDQLHGEAGADQLYGGGENDELWGGPGDDLMEGRRGDDFMRAGPGNDLVAGNHGNDELFGEAGDDRIFGGPGIDVLSGGGDNDQLRGGAEDDTIHGDAGDDSIWGGAGNDHLRGGAGADILEGRSGDDLLVGGPGDDLISGNPGDDHLLGNDGDDRLFGGPGSDTLDGGAGTDFCVAEGVSTRACELP